MGADFVIVPSSHWGRVRCGAEFSRIRSLALDSYPISEHCFERKSSAIVRGVRGHHGEFEVGMKLIGTVVLVDRLFNY